MPVRPSQPVIDRVVPTILYVVESSTGSYSEINFLNGSIQYFDRSVKQSYDNILIDNIGSGDIRVSFRPGLELTSAVIGAKTISSGDSLFIQDIINYIRIYFISSSIVEIVGVSNSDEKV